MTQENPQGRRRLAAIVACGGLLIVGAWFFRHFFWELDPGTGPAGPAVSDEPFHHHWSEAPVVMLGLGDSVTDGYGSTPGHAYFQLLAGAADSGADMQGCDLAHVFPHLSCINRSVSGSTSFEVVEQMEKLRPFPADTLGVVVITTGGNDLIHNYGRSPANEHAMYGAVWMQAQPWIRAFADRLDAIVAKAGTLFPGGAQIFMATIFDPTDGIGDIAAAGLPAWPDGLRILAAYNQEIAACAGRHAQVHIIGVHDAFLGHGIHCAQFWRSSYHADDHGYWFYENLEDPDDRGYDAIRRLFLLAMTRVYAGSATPR